MVAILAILLALFRQAPRVDRDNLTACPSILIGLEIVMA